MTKPGCADIETQVGEQLKGRAILELYEHYLELMPIPTCYSESLSLVLYDTNGYLLLPDNREYFDQKTRLPGPTRSRRTAVAVGKQMATEEHQRLLQILPPQSGRTDGVPRFRICAALLNPAACVRKNSEWLFLYNINRKNKITIFSIYYRIKSK